MDFLGFADYNKRRPYMVFLGGGTKMNDKRMETCCCTGHRDIPCSLEAPLKSAFR